MIKLFNEIKPAFTFEEPITSVYKKNMTYIEFLFSILKKLNETITEVNGISEKIDGYDEFITQIDVEIKQLRSDFETYKIELNADLDSTINQTINELNENIKNAISDLRKYSDARDDSLKSEIDNIIVGDIQVIDPTTGIRSPLQTVLYNLNNASREEALTAEDYDNLELTADEYDSKEITAFDFDRYGKTLLV